MNIRPFPLTAIVCLLFFVTGCFAPVFSQPVREVEVSAKMKTVSLQGALQHIEDNSGALTIDDVLDLERKGQLRPFRSFVSRAVNNFIDPPTLWIHAHLVSADTHDVTWIYDTQLVGLRQGTIFLLRDEKLTQLYEETPVSRGNDRPLHLRTFAAPINLMAGERVDVFVKIKFGASSIFDPRLVLATDHFAAEARAALFNALIYGFCLALAFTGLVISVALKFKPAAIYVPFILSVVSFVVFSDGYGYSQHGLWENEANVYIYRLVIASAAVFGSWFLRAFFDLKTVAPRLNLILYVPIIFGVVTALSVFVSGHPMINAVIFLVCLSLLPLYFLFAAYGFVQAGPAHCRS